MNKIKTAAIILTFICIFTAGKITFPAWGNNDNEAQVYDDRDNNKPLVNQ